VVYFSQILDSISSKGIIRTLVKVDEVHTAIEKIGEMTGNLEFKEAGRGFKTKYEDKFLRKDLVCYIEYPYVDLVYRDTYYKFHSTKVGHKEKDCIRISFFDSKINEDAFDKKALEVHCKGNDYFLGCLIIRPTKLNPIGRTILSPKIYSKKLRSLILRDYTFQINGSKLSVKAFPNSGQDGEYHSCAETSLMSLLSYFAKYDNFNTKLPSEIIALVNKIRTERVTPTEGLKKEEMSFILKHCGFGVKTYSSNNLGEATLKKVFNDYVESGIPIIAILKGNDSNHATIAIGHQNVKDLAPAISDISDAKGITILDSSEFYRKKNYIFIDDNYPSYQHSEFEKPASYYDGKFNSATIKTLIVPLDRRIYLDSLRVRKIFKAIFNHKSHFLRQCILKESINPYIVRYCLTTSNAFKKTICNGAVSLETKKAIDGLILPRFIWLIELSDTTNYQNGRTKGFIIIDSMEAPLLSSIIAIVWSNVIQLGDGLRESSKQIKDTTFPIYENNLMKF